MSSIVIQWIFFAFKIFIKQEYKMKIRKAKTDEFTERKFEKDFYGEEEDRFILMHRILSLTTPFK